MSVSARHTASVSGPAAAASQISSPRSRATVSAAKHHAVLSAKAKRSSVSNGETISYSTAKEDQLAAEKQSSRSDQPCSENTAAVSVCPDPLLINTVTTPCSTDDAKCPAETAVQSAETVTQTAVKHEADDTLHEYSAHANAVDDSDLCNGNLRDIEQSQFQNALSVVCRDESENVRGHVTAETDQMSTSHSEVLDTVVSDENLLPVVSETDDQEPAVTVGCEDVITHLSPLSEPPATDAASEQFSTSEEVDGTEQITDIGGDDGELKEAPVVSYVDEETMLCAAGGGGNKPCVADSTHLLMSSDTRQLEEMPSTVDVVGRDAACSDENVTAISQPAVDGSLHSECAAEFVDDRSSHALDTAADIYPPSSPTTLLYSDMQSCDLQQACAADTEQLSADMQANTSSPTEMYIQDKNAAVDEPYEKVNFTIGQPSLIDNTFRRCSVDLAGRGVLSRIAEESSAGLASVTGDIEQLMEPHQLDKERAASGEFNIVCGLICYFHR